MKEIPLTRGRVAMVDEDDYPVVSAFKWTALFNPRNGKWYARRAEYPEGRKSGKSRTVYLHRFLMNAPKGIQVDHRNGDGLDCQRSNLRLADNSQNHQNMKLQSNNTSGFKGVYPRGKRWFAKLQHAGKQVYCGTHDTKEEAARAYDRKAFELFGEFALPNFPREERAA